MKSIKSMILRPAAKPSLAAASAFWQKACGQEDTKAAQPVGGNEADDLKALGHIELAVPGQFTRDERAGVDLVLVGTVNTNAVNKST